MLGQGPLLEADTNAQSAALRMIRSFVRALIFVGQEIRAVNPSSVLASHRAKPIVRPVGMPISATAVVRAAWTPARLSPHIRAVRTAAIQWENELWKP